MENSEVARTTIAGQQIVTEKLKFKEKLGYAFGDTGCVLVFSLIGSVLFTYYTDVLFIHPLFVAFLFIARAFWDGISDPLWGRFIDTRRKMSPSGRFKIWILRMSPFLSASAVLAFALPRQTTETASAWVIVYAIITFIIFDLAYTTVNVPYGTLASAITDDPVDRSNLSMFRSIGAGLGSLPSMVLTSIMFVALYIEGVPQLNEEGEPIRIVQHGILIVGIAVIALISFAMNALCYKWTKERIPPIEKPKAQKGEMMRVLKSHLKNPAFVALSVASMILIGTQFFTQSFYVYIFNHYFNRQELYAFVMVATYLPIGIFIFIMNRLISKYGKKILCAIGLAVASISNLVLFVIRTQNPFVFLVFCLLSGAGMTILVLQIWAMIIDVIDDHEKKTGMREEGTTYSLVTFSRKIGQAFAGAIAAFGLYFIGYEITPDAPRPSDEAVQSLYTLATLIPAILFAIGFAALYFFYPNIDRKITKT
jgi:GPH family glycoside/pentoside/hexuronide:cation symporter